MTSTEELAALGENAEQAQWSLMHLSRWLDEAPVNADRTPLERTLLRFVKMTEETGETTSEIIGWTGQNPRKGVTSDLDKIAEEALDKAITALGFVEHITGNQGLALPMLYAKIAKVDARRLSLPSAVEVPSDVKIDKLLERL